MISDYKIDGNYLFVLRGVAETFDCPGINEKRMLITKYTNSEEFWIIDLKNNLEVGPLDKQTFGDKAKKFGVPSPELNARTKYFTN